jgi:hypothetical protein
MSIRRHALAAIFCTICASASLAADAPPAPLPDGPWHGRFSCFPAGANPARSAAFGFVVANGTGAANVKLDPSGNLALKFSLDESQHAEISFTAESGEGYLSPLSETAQSELADGALRWVGRWQFYSCVMALLPGPLPPDAEVTAPNDPEGKTSPGSSLRGAKLIAAPNDPEVRTPTTAADNSAPAPAGARDPAVVEVAFWESVKDARDPEELQAYLKRYPSGAFAELAKIRLARIEAK